MKCVIIGDIGWKNLYHLGDEAMTEVALEQLRQRGGTHITLVAGQPHVAEKLYRTPAVPRFGFTGGMTRDQRHRKLKKISQDLFEEQYHLHPLYETLRDADLAVIAGGGNLNSDFSHHIFERLAFARVANHFEVPLAVSSQTVGPYLTDADAPLVEELIALSTVFGVREAASLRLVQQLAPQHINKLTHTLDDASLMHGASDTPSIVSSLGLAPRYIIASFTSHRGTANITQKQYEQQVTVLLDSLAEQLNVDVALVSHTGSLVSTDTGSGKDLGFNRKIATNSRTGRLKHLPMLEAQTAVALTSGALLSVSTRYHPTIFGPGAMIPTVGISLSYYSSVRMRGSLSNVGLQQFVVPELCWDVALNACLEAVKFRDQIQHHLQSLLPESLSVQSRWWDLIASLASAPTPSKPLPKLNTPPPLKLASEVLAHCETITPYTDVLGQERIEHQNIQKRVGAYRKQVDELMRLNKVLTDERDALAKEQETLVKDLQALSSRSSMLNSKLVAATERANRSENRKIVRLTDTVADLFRKQ